MCMQAGREGSRAWPCEFVLSLGVCEQRDGWLVPCENEWQIVCRGQQIPSSEAAMHADLCALGYFDMLCGGAVLVDRLICAMGNLQ